MPELTAATGGLALCETHLGAGLADCPAFQAFVGADDATAAAARIYYNALPLAPSQQGAHTAAQLDEYRPFALIFTDPANGYGLQFAALGEFLERGSLTIQLEQAFPADLLDNPAEAERLFKNTIGGILKELADRRNTEGFLAINSAELLAIGRPAENAIPAVGDCLIAEIRVTHGGRGA